MICALTQKQHNALLKKVAKDVFTMIEDKTAFNIDDYVKYIYDRVYTKTNDQARAVTFASLVPNKLVIARAHSAKIKNHVPGADAIEKLEKDFLDYDSVVKYLKLKKEVKSFKGTSSPEELEAQDAKHANKTIPTVSSGIFSARPDTYFATLGNEDDPKMAFSYAFIRDLINNTGVYSDNTGYHLTAMLAKNAVRESDDYPGFVYKDNPVLNVITDESGEVLYFDENFKQTTPENGKPVAFFLRNKADKVQTSAELMSHSADKVNPKVADQYLKDQQEKINSIIQYIKGGKNRKITSKIVNAKTGFIDVKYNKYSRLSKLKLFIQDPVIQVFNTQKEIDENGRERNRQVYALTSSNDKEKFNHKIVFRTIENSNVNNGEFIEDMLDILLGNSDSILRFDKKATSEADLVEYKKDILSTFFGNNFSYKSKFFVESNTGQIVNKEGYEVSRDELRNLLTTFTSKGKLLESKLNILSKNYGSGVIWYEKITKDGTTKYSIKPVGVDGALSASEYINFIIQNSETSAQPNKSGEITPIHPYLVFETDLGQMDKIDDTEEVEEVVESTDQATQPSTGVKPQEIISTTPEQLKKDVKSLLKESLKKLKEANATGKTFILGFHGGKTFDKPDRNKQYTGEFRNPDSKRIAESMGARYEGQMLFYTEDLSETDLPHTYEDAINGATGYAIKYGDDTPSIQAYLIPIDNADFANRGVGEVGVSYDDIEANKIRKIGSVDFTRTTQPTTQPAVVIKLKPSAKKIEERTLDIEEFEEPSEGSIEDLKEKFKKNKVELQKLSNTPVSEEQLLNAVKWYNNYKTTVKNKDGSTSEKSLKDIVPFVALFDRINSANTKEIANVTNAGITLFKGSDFSDLYHEAFHVFVELFLTAKEKQSAFNAVRKQSGSFVDHEGKTVKFADADDLQVEEYLAEEFRKYMLSDGKKGADKAPVVKSFFSKLLDFLKAFFNVDVESGLLNYEASSELNTLFNNLRVGNISSLKYGYENRFFDKKTKISALVDDLQNVLDEIKYSLQSEIVDSIDSIFSEAADSLDLIYDAEQNGQKSTSQIVSNLESRAYVYSKYVLKRFIQEQKRLGSELREMKIEDPKYRDTSNRVKALQVVIKNFSHTTVLKGTTADITTDDILLAQKDGKGLIAYHMQKSKFLTYEERFDVLDPEEQSKIPGGEYSKKSGNEVSAKDLASKEVLYLISSLFKYEKGKVVKNGFGFNQLENFDISWNKLSKLLEGSKDGDEIESRLKRAAVDPKIENKEFFSQVLNKLGKLNSFPDGVKPILSQINLWTKFIQVYTLDRVPLIQVTVKMNTETSTVDVNVGAAVRETDHIKRAWENRFTSPADTDRYIKKQIPGTAAAGDIKRGGTSLDSKKVLEDFKDTYKTDPIRFLNAIGMNVSDVIEIKNQLLSESGPVAGFTKYIYNSIKKLSDANVGIYKIATIVGEEETGRYNALLSLESRFSDTSGSNIVSNAKGDAQYELMLRSTVSKMISILNEVGSYSELIGKNSTGEYNYPEMSHLNYKRNPGIKNSEILKTLFGPNFWEGEGKKTTTSTMTSGLKKSGVSLLNSAGVALTKDEYHLLGQSSIESDETTNILQNFYMSIMYGVSHSTQHADKSSTYLYKIAFPPGKKHFIDVDKFKSNTGTDLFRSKLMGYLSSEISRMFLLRDNDPSGTATVGDGTYKDAGSDFVIFEDILVSPSPRNKKISLKDELIKNFLSKENFLNEINEDKNTDIRDVIEKDINSYLDKQVEDFTKDISKTGATRKAQLMKAITGQAVLNDKLNEVFFTAYVANDWIQKYETTTLFYGDVALYNMIKEELHKRNAGIAATGTFPRTDSAMINLLNGYYADKYKNSEIFKSESFALTDYAKNRKRGKTLNSAIVEDTKLKSLYVDKYREIAVEKEKERFARLNKEFTAEDKKRIESQYDEYDKMKIGDAQGWVTFDSYRAILFSMDKWSQYQEDMYNAIVEGKEVDTADILQFFPIKKMQYWGPLAAEKGLPLYAFHKFSLMPLIPTLIKNSHLETLHNRMVSQGIDYATFQSGSKINSITKNGTVDKFYNDPSDPSMGVAFENNDYEFTRNELFIEFFKDQLETSDQYKNSVIFSTQLRKLIEEGLYENGKPISFTGTKEEFKALTEEEKKKYSEYKKIQNYEKLVEQLTNFKIKELEKETDFTYDEKTKKYNLTQKFVDYIKKQLTVQDLAEHEIDFIKYDSSGSLVYDLSIHPSAEKIERLLAALVYKKIVRQKVNGEALIQVSGAGFEPSGLRSASDEERKKYGQDGLSFYEYSKDGTRAMQAKIALQGDFKKLLKLPEVKEKVKAARGLGRNINELQALNELIKDKNWVEKNRNLITIAGVRIPVQGLNSMEFIQVAEFLPESSGNMIILPREIVAKSGSDFDIDKMSLMFPSLLKTSKGVSLVKHTPGMDIDIDVTKEKIKDLYKQLDIANDQVSEFSKEYFKSVPSENRIEFFNLLKNYKVEIKKINFEIHGQMEMGDTFPETLYDELYTFQEKIIELLNDQVKPIKEYKEKTVDVIMNQIDELKTNLASASSKGIENELLFAVTDILSTPSNFIDLVTPNGTYLVKPLADELLEDVRDYNPYDTNSGEAYTYNKGGKAVKRVSGTRMFELRYNRYKQQSNNIGKKTLGMGAVDNTYNTIFNRVGAYLASSIMLGVKKPYEVLQKIKGMKHNIMLDPKGKEVISLSNIYDADNENKISTVISQMINGWVDVAKDSWIFDIQGNPEISSTLLFMIQAGVPLKQAVYFVSQPVIRDYVTKQRNIRGVFGQPLGIPSAGTINFRTQARRELARDLFKIDPKSKALDNMLLKRTIYTELIPKYLPEEPNFSNETLRENIAKRKSEGYTEVDQQVFLHFIELEEMAKATTKVKLAVNFDTDKLSSLYEINEKIDNFRSLSEENRFPFKIVEEIMKESPIGSFYYNKELLGLISSLFPTRDNENLKDRIKENFSNLSTDDVTESYGRSFPTKEKLIGTFINDFTGYILQQHLYNPNRFNAEAPYRGVELSTDVDVVPAIKLSRGAFVIDGKLYISNKTINSDFDKKEYDIFKKTYIERGLAPVPESFFNNSNVKTSKMLFTKYVYEREILRASYPFEEYKETKDYQYRLKNLRDLNTYKDPEIFAYEEFLRDTALLNTLNLNFMFKSNNGFAKQIEAISAKYPDLRKKYTVLDSLYPTQFGGVINLKIRELLLDSKQAAIYNEQIELLSDPHTQKVDNEIDNHIITKLFNLLPLFSIVQSGQSTKGSYSLSRIVDQTKLAPVMSDAILWMNGLNEDDSFAFSNEYLSQFKTMYETRADDTNYPDAIDMGSEEFASAVKPRIKNYSNYYKGNPTDKESFIKTSNYDRDVKLYNVQGSLKEFKENVKKTEGVRFVIESSIESYSNLNKGFVEPKKEPATYNSTVLRDMVENKEIPEDKIAPIVTKQKAFIVLPEHLITDKDYESNTKRIDLWIDQLIKYKEEGSVLVFNENGYGNTYLGYGKGEVKTKENRIVDIAPAPETFVYLSKELYKNFGYINPGYSEVSELTPSGKTLKEEIFATEVATDDVVREKLKECFKSIIL